MGLCDFIQAAYLVTSAVVFFGYTLKGGFIFMGGGSDALVDSLESGSLWVPDFTFWLMGISSVIILMALMALFGCVIEGIIDWILKALRWILCPCCPEEEASWEDNYDVETGTFNRRRKSLPLLKPMGR